MIIIRVKGYLWWNDASTDDQDIWPVELPQFLDELWDQGLVPRGKRADPDAVYVCIDRLLGNLEGSLFTQKSDMEKQSKHNSESGV